MACTTPDARTGSPGLASSPAHPWISAVNAPASSVERSALGPRAVVLSAKRGQRQLDPGPDRHDCAAARAHAHARCAPCQLTQPRAGSLSRRWLSSRCLCRRFPPGFAHPCFAGLRTAHPRPAHGWHLVVDTAHRGDLQHQPARSQGLHYRAARLDVDS